MSSHLISQQDYEDYDTFYFRVKITEVQRGSMTWLQEYSQNVVNVSPPHQC